MSGGRPTKYTPELLEAASKYLTTYEDEGHAFPSDIGLADVIGIATSTLYDWAQHEDKAEFSDILDQINRKQQLVAWNKGLRNEYNATLVKLLLGKHGFHDKQDSTYGISDKFADFLQDIDGKDSGLTDGDSSEPE